jgi:hypothetical protein
MEVIEAEGFAPAADRIDLADVARRAAGILGVRAREKGLPSTRRTKVPHCRRSESFVGCFRCF